MKNILSTLVLMSASLTFAQQPVKPISEALEELFDSSRTQAKLPVQQQPYLKIIPSKTSERSTLIYRCRYVAAKSITDSVESATSTTGTVETSDDQNMITVNDINGQIDELKDLILSLDSRGPQVLVEAQIVEVQMGDSMEWDTGLNATYYDKDKGATSTVGSALGERLNYYNPASETSTTTSKTTVSPGQLSSSNGGWFDVIPVNTELSNGDVLSLNAKLKWLKSNNKAEILSSPNLLVDLGATGSVSTGTDLPLLKTETNSSGASTFSTYYKRTGVNLRVTPEIINNDTVTIQVRPEVTSVVRTEILNEDTKAPVISVRNIDTKLNVGSGGVVMMGGLYSSKNIESEQKVPYLSEIPLLGNLFRSTTQEAIDIQLVFLLKVTIVPDAVTAQLSNADATQHEVKAIGAILEKSITPEKQPGDN